MFQEHKGVKMKAKKFIEKTVEGEYEIIKNHVIKVKEDIAIEEIVDRLGLYDEDGETAYFEYGLIFDFDGDLHIIEVNDFISGVIKRLDQQKDEEYWDIEREDIDRFRKELKKLEKYKDYDLYL